MTFCILDSDCAVYDRHTEIPGIVRGSYICEGCRNRIRSDLNALRYDFIDLSQQFVPADSRQDANIFRPKPESSPPLDMLALGLRDDIVALLTAAEDAVRSYVGDRPRQAATRDGYAVDAAIRYLEERCEHLAAVPAVRAADELLRGTDIPARLRQLHRRVRRCVGLLEPVIALPGPCPRCGVAALRRRDDGSDRVWCQQCHTAMTRDQYHAACRMVFAAPVTDETQVRST